MFSIIPASTLAAAGGNDNGIFFGGSGGYVGMTNIVNSSGVVVNMVTI